MRKIICLVTLGFAINFHVLGQSSIIGNVYDKHQKEIEGFNVILLNKTDSTIIKGGFFFDGNFKIEYRPGNYLLQISALSYRDTLLPVAIDKPEVRISPIYLSASNIKLKEVEITANRVLYSQQSDKLILNVENNTLSESGSVVDVLKKSVKLTVNKDDEITVLGKGKAHVYLNGRKIPSNQVLSMISSEEIKKVEIIENPSSEYAADATAVVNIITRKDGKYGSGAKIINTLTKRTDWDNRTNVQFSQHTLKNNLYASYSFSNKKRFYENEYIRDYTNTSAATIINNIDEKLSLNQLHFFRLNDNYQLNDKNTIGVSINTGFYKGYYNTKNHNQIFHNKDLQETNDEFFTHLCSPLNRTLLNGLVTYTFAPGIKGTEWKFSAEKYYHESQKNDFITENNQTEKKNNVANRFNLNAFDINVVFPLTEKIDIKSGSRYSQNRNNSENYFQSSINEYSEKFVSSEHTLSGFGLLNYTEGNWIVDAGLRMEYMDRESIIDNQLIVNDKTVEWLPNIMLSRTINKKLQLSLSYNRKIKRPSFQDLNPAISYIDSLSYMQGNPELTNEKINSCNLKITYMKYASLSFYYKNVKDAIVWYIEPSTSNPLVSLGTQKNIAQQEMFGADLLLPYQTKGFTVYVASGLKQTNNKSDACKYLNALSWYISSGIDINLPLGMKTNLSGMYFSDGINGIWNYKGAWQCDANLQKSFFKDRLNFALSFEDIFRSNKIQSQLELDDRMIKYNYYYDTSSIEFRISYKFKNLKSKPKIKSVLREDTNRIKSNLK